MRVSTAPVDDATVSSTPGCANCRRWSLRSGDAAISRPVARRSDDFERAVARARRAATVAVVDEHADVLSHQRQRDAELQHVAVARALPDRVDARLFDRLFAAVFAGFDAARVQPAGARAAEEQLLLATALVVEGQPDAVADARGIERRQHPRRRNITLVIAHQQREIQPALVRRGQQAQLNRRPGRQHE